ncbi:MAG: hypothetical protein NDI61_01740 [Bdellovibrionaceae bacterium]|nr:hypothetical protein [Pseudobdellovibrionaceae bacterium]
MKKFVALFAFGAIAFATQVSQAASIESCINQVDKACHRVSERAADAMRYGSQCKIVRHGSQTDYVAFVSYYSQRITSVDLNDCGTSSYTFQTGRITDLGVLEGRLFLTLSSNRVAFVGRNNRILELNNSKGAPYESVTSLKIDQPGGRLILVRGNQETILDRDQIQNRIDQGKMTILAESY